MKALQLRLDRLEQRHQARLPVLSPVVLYTLGEALPELMPHPEGGVFFLIPDNGREPVQRGGTSPGGNA